MMARSSYIEGPTQTYPLERHEADRAQELPVLTAGVFNEDQIAVLYDVHATDDEKLRVIGQARANDPDEDLQGFLYDQHDYQKNPQDVAGNLHNLFEGCVEYAKEQEKIQRRLDDTEFVVCITPHDRELLSDAPIKQKNKWIEAIHSDFLTVRTQVADYQSIEGFTPWLEDENPEEARSLNALPMNERLEKLRQHHKEFIVRDVENHRRQMTDQRHKDSAKVTAVIREREAAEKLADLLENPALTNFLAKSKKPVAADRLLDAGVPATKVLSLVNDQYRSNEFKKYQAKHDRKTARLRRPQAITLDIPKEVSYTPGLAEKLAQKIDTAKTEWLRLPYDVRRRAVVAAGVAVAATAAFGSLNNSDNRGLEGKTPITIIGEAGKVKKTALHTPSEAARKLAGLSRNDTIAEQDRNKIIVAAGEAYVAGRVGNISLELGKLSLGSKDLGRLTINKIDEIALSSLDLLTHRPGVTPGLTDAISQQISNIMLTARYPDDFNQDTLKTDPDSPFHKELVQLLEITFKNDPGMDRYSHEERQKIYAMQAEVITTLTPETAQEDVINVFRAILARADKTLESNQKQAEATSNSAELEELNPRYSLGQIIAAISIFESGRPANPNAENWAKCKGYMQFCFWEEWAGQELGDSKAPLTPANQTIVTMKKMLNLLEHTGSADAAAASWLKGPGVGIDVASKDIRTYNNAISKKDGNGTSIETYMTTMEERIKNVDIHEQLPFLKEVIKQHPKAVDWSLLDKEYPLYSYRRLRQVKPHANQVIKNREERERRLTAGAAGNRATRTEKGGLKIAGATDLGM